ncbi:putative pentatricopeptide repeat protein [Plasmodium gaboni]|uniref:Putative pentatricopeptide repeat protein n=1 Tax=Plasmodium gaboni TaxID=647221 RepID=A0A151LGS2_9APIC|nr:putative pentatricopeptide repeat protein [Plasmodium gaboni]KYN98133.1 putative pentatricopeptide repeat protein [Plasmodium gaboni]
MNSSILFSHLKEFTIRNKKYFLYEESQKNYKSCIVWYMNHYQRLSGSIRRYSNVLGQLVDRKKKNLVNIEKGNEILKSYKRVNLKKILKDGDKKKESYENENIINENIINENIVSENIISENIISENIINENIISENIISDNIVNKAIKYDEGEKRINKNNMNMKNKNIYDINTNSSTFYTHNHINDENVKNSVDELFCTKEKKKQLMKRIIFQNNHDYMHLIERYEEYKAKQEDEFYNSSYEKNEECSSYPSFIKKKEENKCNDDNNNNNVNEKMYEEENNKCKQNNNNNNNNNSNSNNNDVHYYLYEVDKDNEESNVNMHFNFLKKNLNISIFPEIGKKDILESCKRKKNMQNEINKNSDIKNIFNNDIYFWKKRKVHRAIGWDLIPANLKKKDDIIDVSELTYGHLQNCKSEELKEDNNREVVYKDDDNSNNNKITKLLKKQHINEDIEKKIGKENISNIKGISVEENISMEEKKSDMNTQLNDINLNKEECEKKKKSYIQRRVAPCNFLKKLNIYKSDVTLLNDDTFTIQMKKNVDMMWKEDNTEIKKEKEKEEEKKEEEKKEEKKTNKKTHKITNKSMQEQKLIDILLNNDSNLSNVEKMEYNKGEVNKEEQELNKVDIKKEDDEYDEIVEIDSCKNDNMKNNEKNMKYINDSFNNMNGEYDSYEYHDKTYEGIVDNSKNVFKKMKENYDMFKKNNMSPYILEDCEKYINYYYGIEKEEKIKELRKYADMDFYEIMGNGNFSIEDYNMLIKSKILFNKEEEGFHYFNLLKKYDIRINIETYNSLMYTCIVQKNAKLSRLIYLQIIKDLFIPNKNTFCILIKAHILDKDIKSAFHLYRKMIKENIEVDIVIYSTLIDGLIKNKLYKRAEQFFNYIVNYKNVVPDEILYTIMIKNCAYNREAEKCLNYYEIMLSENLRITDITLIEIINCLSRREDYFYKVFYFYNIYVSNEMKINHRLMLYMIIACSNKGNIKRLKEILKTMNKNKIKISDEMYCYIVRTFANNCKDKRVSLSERHNNIKYAWRIIYDLLKGSSIGIKYIDKKKYVGDIDQIICEKENITNNPTDDNKILQTYNKKKNDCVSVDSVNDVYERTEVDSFRSHESINTKLLNSLILLYINCEYYEYAVNMLKYFSYFECVPDYYTFHMLFNMLYYKLKDYSKVLCLYDYMINNTENKPNEKILNLILNCAIQTKSSKNTLFILRQMFTYKIYPSPQMVKKLYHVGRYITEIQILINSMISQQKKDVYEVNLKDNQLIQLNIDEYELNLFKEGKTFKTKTPLDQVREQFFKRKQRIEKEKRMSKNKKSSDWLPYGQYLQSKKKGGEMYARRVDRPRPSALDE